MKRKITVLLVLMALFVTQVGAGGLSTYAYAATTDSSNEAIGYFYNQLDGNAKKMYNAMEKMDTKGIFKTGTGDYDLSENDYFSQDAIKKYTEGDSRLLKSMGEARDAFQADHPEIFYVDFSQLSLRVTKDSSGKYHAYLGTGRSDNYFTEGFTSESQVDAAIKEYNAKVDEYVKAAKAVTVKSGSTLEIEEVKAVHEKLINEVSYRMEGVCDKGNDGFVHCAYGALVKGQAVCEGYAKAFKNIMDELNIPCIQVQGVARTTADTPEGHMWNYVKIGDLWYGVDATWDDPVDPTGKTNTQGVDGFETTEYLLATDVIMNVSHIPSGIMSSVGYEFTYPELTNDELGYDTVVSDGGLKVEYNPNGTTENGTEGGSYKVSYNGMGYAKAASQGKYILGKFYQYSSSEDDYVNGGWGYLLPDVYNIEDTDTELTLTLPQIPYVEFAVTDIAPKDYTSGDLEQIKDAVTYTGDPLLFLAQSGKLYNENSNYVAPPYIKTSTPNPSGRLKIGTTYPVTVEYDEDLEQIDGEEVSYELSSTGTTAEKYAKIENFKWDGKRTITFDFTPSEMWADDSIVYNIQPTGLQGKESKKIPNTINYTASHGCVAFAYRAQGYDWNAFGKPTMISNGDLSTYDFQTKDGTSVTASDLNNLVLVTTKASTQQTKEMDSVLEANTSGQTVLSEETYNINLTLCKSQIVKTGDSVRVSVGFPEGYSADDEGVTFKAYHFTKNDQGEIVDVQEIGCVVTQYGLIVTCDSFSPFTICAVKDTNASANTDKTVMVSNNTGGSVTLPDSATDSITLKDGETKDITVTADKGYSIESITIDGTAQEITDTSSAKISLSYDDIAGTAGIVDVKFVADSVAKKEAAQGETAVAETLATVINECENHTYGDWTKVRDASCSLEGEESRICSVCGYEDVKVIDKTEHTWSDWTVTKKATVLEKGTQTRTCSVCKETETQDIAKLDASIEVNPTSITLTAGKSYSGVKVNYNTGDGIASWKSSNTSVATVNSAGKITAKKAGTANITVTLKSGKQATIKVTVKGQNQTLTLSAKKYTYDGKAKTPKVTVKDKNGKTISKSNYTVKYSGNHKKVGTYKVTVTLKGNYSGTLTATYKINPKGTSLTKMYKRSKGFTAMWKKQGTQTTGYQVQYSTNSKFNNAKTVNVTKTNKISKRVTGLKGKTKYYVRVRTYKTVGETKYYSGWSKAKTVTTYK